MHKLVKTILWWFYGMVASTFVVAMGHGLGWWNADRVMVGFAILTLVPIAIYFGMMLAVRHELTIEDIGLRRAEKKRKKGAKR